MSDPVRFIKTWLRSDGKRNRTNTNKYDIVLLWINSYFNYFYLYNIKLIQKSKIAGIPKTGPQKDYNAFPCQYLFPGRALKGP